MKKFISLLCIFALLFGAPSALAESSKPDISRDSVSKLNYYELYYLHQVIAQEMHSREEFTEIVIPPGVYKVGFDLPKGLWKFYLVDQESGYATLDYCKVLDNTETTYREDALLTHVSLTPKSPSWQINLQQGDYLIVNHESVILSTRTYPSFQY